jgi:nifR3 family TIM-barrel protein
MERDMSPIDVMLRQQTNNVPPVMHIGDLTLENRLILAPLAGILTLSLRQAYRKLGAAMTCIGVVDAEAVVQGGEGKLINILGREEVTHEEERPLSVQLIGSEIPTVVEAAKQIEKYACVIDLNFSGPIKRVMDRGCGAATLKNPGFIGEMVGATVGNVSVPVTAKIRIGIEGEDVDVVKVAQACEERGASAVVVHARSARQGYTGPAHWDSIKKVKASVGIPVVGNGAVHSAFDAKAMLEETGCDCVMIGTSAIINPLIFEETNRLLQAGVAPRTNHLTALMKFMRQYRRCAKRLESQGALASYRRFLSMRSYMKKIKAGTVTLT